MSTKLWSSVWFVSLSAVAVAGCGPSADVEPLDESRSASRDNHGGTGNVSGQTPDKPPIPTGYEAIGLAEPKLGPLVEFAVPTDLGKACHVGTQCRTGHCVDGVCCDVPCDGVCEACDLRGSVGFCTAICGDW